MSDAEARDGRFWRVTWMMLLWLYCLAAGVGIIAMIAMHPSNREVAALTVQHAAAPVSPARRIPSYDPYAVADVKRRAVDFAKDQGLAAIVWTAEKNPATTTSSGATIKASLMALVGLAPSAQDQAITETQQSWDDAVADNAGILRSRFLAPLESMIEILSGELKRYPPEFIKQRGLKRFAFREIISLTNGHVFSGQANFADHAIELDARRILSSGHAWARLCVHHELYHVIDFNDGAGLGHDREWRKLNSPGFEYGYGGSAYPNGTPSATPAGFASHYATASVEEDKAELFALMVADPVAADEMLRKDDRLRAKAELLKNRLQSLDSRMGEAFWQAIAKPSP